MKFPRLDYVAVEEWLLSYVKGQTVLHLGCAGDLLQHGKDACLHYRLSKVCTTLCGIEIDKTAMETVKVWVPEDKDGRIRYFCGDVAELDKLGIRQKFRIIIAGSIIEHLSNPGLMLQHMRSFCQDDGKVIIVTPHVFGLMQFIRVALKADEAVNREHTCWFSIATLTELCSRHGLRPIEWYTGYGWQPPSLRWRIQRTLGVPFFRAFPRLGGSLIGVFVPR
jgi:2-polyprenyl-3-methyl-5-hydroxy-6-metoxy-1,4-benzoquinol methylase